MAVHASSKETAHNSAGVFDGHGGEAAADYLRKNFYNAFSTLVSEEVYAKECSVEGTSLFPSLAWPISF